MFIVKYYILIAIAAAIAAFYAPNIYFTVMLGWIALSLGAVSFAYVSKSPWIFRKNDRGSIPLYVRWIFIPFLLGAQIYNAWERKNDSVPPIQAINGKLFLACRLFPSDTEALKEDGVCAILDATAEFSGMNWSADDENLDYLNVPILDHQTPKEDDLIKAVNWIHNHLRKDQGVVVHCALGRGRSVLIVAAYLISAGHAESVDDAMEKINTIRGTARLNNYQYEKLQELHEKGALNLKTKALVIANPVAGGGKWKDAQAQIEQVLGQKYQLSIVQTQKDTSINEQLKDTSLEQYDTVIACGGDGTVSEIAKELLEKDLHLAIIPLGTTNAISHVLYGSKTKVAPVQSACDIILAQHLIEMDAAKCNQTLMLLAAGVGFEQKMIEGAGRDQKDESGEMAYISALLNAVAENESKQYKVSIDGKKAKSIEASSIIVANAAPMTTLLAQGQGEPNPRDGKLDVTVLNTQASTSEPMVKLASQALSSGSMNFEESDDFAHYFATKIQIQSDGKLEYVVDGELAHADELNIKILPKAFKVFASSDLFPDK